MAEFISKGKATEMASNHKQSGSNLQRSTSKGRNQPTNLVNLQYTTQSGDNIGLGRA